MPASVLAYPDVGLLPAADLCHLPWVLATDSLCCGLQYTGCLAFSYGSREEAAKGSVVQGKATSGPSHSLRLGGFKHVFCPTISLSLPT